jgi:hypothetical protein
LTFFSGLKMDDDQAKDAVDKFIQERMDSVPHIEAFLLLWNNRPQAKTVEEMSRALFLAPELTKRILLDLAQQGLISPEAGSPERFYYAETSAEKDSLIADVDTAYRRDLIRLTRMIHAKGPPAALAFARAFRFTKDNEKE